MVGFVAVPAGLQDIRRWSVRRSQCDQVGKARRMKLIVRMDGNESAEENDKWKIPQEFTSGEKKEGGESAVTEQEEREKLWAEIEALERYLKRLVGAEKYGDAAEIKKEIDELMARDPYESLKAKLELAVEEERYMDAAEIRDTMRKVTPPPRSKPAEKEGAKKFPPANASNKCDGVSNGIRIAVESFYLDEASKPKENVFVFGYKVKITNESSRTVQLISREWKIKTAAGSVTEVKGSGVVGRQPVLEPKETFTYTSMCPLKSAEEAKSGAVIGSMKGLYKFVTGDTGTETFDADINEFFHIYP